MVAEDQVDNPDKSKFMTAVHHELLARDLMQSRLLATLLRPSNLVVMILGG